jgi:hydrogenase-4 component B
MWVIVIAVCLLFLSGFVSLISGGSPRRATLIGVTGTVTGCIAGLIPCINVLSGGHDLFLRFNWGMPYGSFYMALDPLSAFFLIPVFIISALASIYGSQYITAWYGKKSIGTSWFFFNVLAASMVMVVTARNAVLFLMSWELMSLASFFLVTFENEKEEVRKAGIRYLIAAHLSAVFLLAVFILLGRGEVFLDFDKFSAGGVLSTSFIFIFALIGFGIKAGFMPFHVWLPEAHPAAPSHVSAIMSAVMIKTGIYGLLRIMSFLGTPSAWWGWLLIGIGVISAVLGALFAFVQNDLKRLLAYCSVENMGIIALGLGMGVMGMSLNQPLLTLFGFSGALLHVVNHAVFKGLLFLGAGAVCHAAGTRDMDDMGGLLKHMPWTGITFFIGAAAIAGLPPLNGFLSEFLIYFGAFKGLSAGGASGMYSVLIIISLAAAGSLAVGCFAKAFGIVFLGNPRTEHRGDYHEAGLAMRIPMFFLAAMCILTALSMPLLIRVLNRILPLISDLPREFLYNDMEKAAEPLIYVLIMSLVFCVLLTAAIITRRGLIMKRGAGRSITWDCGYVNPTPKMQYTSSSFSRPIARFFKIFLNTRYCFSPFKNIFPGKASFCTENPDLFHEYFYRVIFERICGLFVRFRWFQHGRLQLYILYIVITLLILLIWKFW